jgi:hypothetical protein
VPPEIVRSRDRKVLANSCWDSPERAITSWPEVPVAPVAPVVILDRQVPSRWVREDQVVWTDFVLLDVGVHLFPQHGVQRWIVVLVVLLAKKRAWDPENSPVDRSLGDWRRRIKVSGVNPLLFDSELKTIRLAETLARFPEGWSDEHVSAPLVVASREAAELKQAPGLKRAA